jgi:hypothetical protein
VDGDKAFIQWAVPDASEKPDIQQVAYVAHLLQAGLLSDPMMPIANTAYSGGLMTLAMNLLSINSSGRNRYMAERDARLLAAAAPLSSSAVAFLGMILLENGKADDAAEAFMAVQEFDPLDFLSCKYGAISLTLSQPADAVAMCERCIEILAARGMAPDSHLRAAYGMALASAGSKVEAGVQFMLACGSRKVAMTPSEWVSGGYRINDEDVAAALAPKPKKG